MVRSGSSNKARSNPHIEGAQKRQRGSRSSPGEGPFSATVTPRDTRVAPGNWGRFRGAGFVVPAPERHSPGGAISKQPPRPEMALLGLGEWQPECHSHSASGSPRATRTRRVAARVPLALDEVRVLGRVLDVTKMAENQLTPGVRRGRGSFF